MKTSKSLAIGLSLMLGAVTTSSIAAPGAPTYRVDAMVQSMERAPDMCVQKKESDGNALIGALIGGVIGNQFGGGKGRVAMTVVGAGAGAAVASKGGKYGKTECSRDGYVATVSYIHPVTSQMITQRVPLERRTNAKYINIQVQ